MQERSQRNKVTKEIPGSKKYIMDSIHEKNFRREDYLKRSSFI